MGFDIHHSLSPHSLPKLRILSSTISVCSGLIVGRPVEEIRITELGLLQNAPPMEGFTQHPHFKRLEFHLCLIAMLPLLGDCLGKLESLTVCVVRVYSTSLTQRRFQAYYKTFFFSFPDTAKKSSPLDGYFTQDGKTPFAQYSYQVTPILVQDSGWGWG